MSKPKEHHAAPKVEPVAEPAAVIEVASVCSVCGQGGNLDGAAGVARWHSACETARPDVIARVKARS